MSAWFRHPKMWMQIAINGHKYLILSPALQVYPNVCITFEAPVQQYLNLS
jgi:hypothetical protein